MKIRLILAILVICSLFAACKGASPDDLEDSGESSVDSAMGSVDISSDPAGGGSSSSSSGNGTNSDPSENSDPPGSSEPSGSSDPGGESSSGANIPTHVMIHISGGTFSMGSPIGEPGRYTDENQHEVVLTKSFYMGKYPVTQELYFFVMGANPSYFSFAKGRPAVEGEAAEKRPVEQVSWYDTLVFCNRLSLKEGLSPVYSVGGSTDPESWGPIPDYSGPQWNVSVVSTANGYRLPTEAEWEYACRAGTQTAYYTGPDAFDVETGWWQGNSGNEITGGTHEVGKMPANAWLLCDMSGNVNEWVWDWHLGTYYTQADAGLDPTGPASGSTRVFRGGSWYEALSNMRSAFRIAAVPDSSNFNRGFRVVRAAP